MNNLFEGFGLPLLFGFSAGLSAGIILSILFIRNFKNNLRTAAYVVTIGLMLLSGLSMGLSYSAERIGYKLISHGTSIISESTGNLFSGTILAGQGYPLSEMEYAQTEFEKAVDGIKTEGLTDTLILSSVRRSLKKAVSDKALFVKYFTKENHISYNSILAGTQQYATIKMQKTFFIIRALIALITIIYCAYCVYGSYQGKKYRITGFSEL